MLTPSVQAVMRYVDTKKKEIETMAANPQDEEESMIEYSMGEAREAIVGDVKCEMNVCD